MNLRTAIIGVSRARVACGLRRQLVDRRLTGVVGPEQGAPAEEAAPLGRSPSGSGIRVRE